MNLNSKEDNELLNCKSMEKVGKHPRVFVRYCPCHECCKSTNKEMREVALAYRQWIAIRLGLPFDTRWITEAPPEYRAPLIEAICLRAIK